jgi:hypothetical protein
MEGDGGRHEKQKMKISGAAGNLFLASLWLFCVLCVSLRGAKRDHVSPLSSWELSGQPNQHSGI